SQRASRSDLRVILGLDLLLLLDNQWFGLAKLGGNGRAVALFKPFGLLGQCQPLLRQPVKFGLEEYVGGGCRSPLRFECLSSQLGYCHCSPNLAANALW